MPAPRKRTDGRGRALPCVASGTRALAEVLYRERMRGRYRDETELVVAIIREWAAKLEAVEWAEVLAELRKEEDAEAAAQEPAPPKGKDKKK